MPETMRKSHKASKHSKIRTPQSQSKKHSPAVSLSQHSINRHQGGSGVRDYVSEVKKIKYLGPEESKLISEIVLKLDGSHKVRFFTNERG